MRRSASSRSAARLPGSEIILLRPLGGVRQIDLAVLQPLQQVFRRQVHQLDIVGAVENGIGHRLAHPHMGDLGHHIVQAFDVLDIEGGIDVDPRRQQLFDIQIALGMAAARGIVVRQLVHQHQARPALQDGVQIHLRQHPALVGHALLGNGLDALGEKIGLDPAMGFHHADHRIHAFQLAAAGLHQHLIGLADARRRAQENLQPATPGLPRFFQQGVRRGASASASVIRPGD